MRAIDAATTTNSSTSPAANAIATAAANEPRIAPQNTTGRHHSPSDARRLRFAAAWHRRSTAGTTADPSLRPAYAAPIAAPEAPPADALVVTPQSLDAADDGERLIAIAPDGRRLSKRDQDLDLGKLRQRMTPEELLGMLAYCAGIVDRTGPVSLQELVCQFSWDKVRRDGICLGAEMNCFRMI